MPGVALVWLLAAAWAGEPTRPWVDRIFPLSGQRGTVVKVEIRGSHLSNVRAADFHTADIEWVRIEEARYERIRGEVRIRAEAALGPHVITLTGADGPSNSRLFNVTQFPLVLENEPNDVPAKAQPIRLEPQSIQGYMKGEVDVDLFAFDARAGERWTFDVRSLEYGTHLESSLTLLDGAGRRVAFNEDRDDYDESPLLEHVFAGGGRYFLKLDQYRGPQGVTCAENCGYSIEISRLPRLMGIAPLGARPGETARFTIEGTGLEDIGEAWLSPVRTAEYYRMTYPFTFPIRYGADPERGSAAPRIEGKVQGSSLEFSIPAGVSRGLWRLWVAGPRGATSAFNIDIGDGRTFAGRLLKPGAENTFRVEGRAGEPLRLWTLAAQLGLPEIDTVIELRDASGKTVASHDDVMSGQGTPVGNPDSSLVYTPAASGPLTAHVRDRIGRGGPGYAYLLKAAPEHAGYQLLTSPENFSVPRGGSAVLTVFLIREPGFEGEVPVWFEDLPPGVTAETGRFRADQAFGPSADGDNMIIPELALKITVPAALASGSYPLRLFGKGGPDGRRVAAHTSLWIGPPRNRNDIRRPRPAVTMAVTEPAPMDWKPVVLARGGNARLELEGADAEVRLANAPRGVAARVAARQGNRMTLELTAAKDVAMEEGKDLAAEVRIGERWVAVPISLQ